MRSLGASTWPMGILIPTLPTLRFRFKRRAPVNKHSVILLELKGVWSWMDLLPCSSTNLCSAQTVIKLREFRSMINWALFWAISECQAPTLSIRITRATSLPPTLVMVWNRRRSIQPCFPTSQQGMGFATPLECNQTSSLRTSLDLIRLTLSPDNTWDLSLIPLCLGREIQLDLTWQGSKTVHKLAEVRT